MKENRKKKYNPAKQPCRQEPGMEDCFARNHAGNCAVLTDTGYPCGECPFYKPLGGRLSAEQEFAGLGDGADEDFLS